MEEPKSLDNVFNKKIFRIPDYQRGYAWKNAQLEDFWDDLINLSQERKHYTGVLTLKEIPSEEISKTDKEYWLVDEHSYRVYHIVDGQQRLTTFIILIQSLIDFLKKLPENQGKGESQIYITESLNITQLQDQYLFKIKPRGDQFRTYKFGYSRDNPSYEYLRHRIFAEEGGGSVEETYYTFNMSEAKTFFIENLGKLYQQENMEGIRLIHRKLTQKFVFNEYIIQDEFDVFVAFETMNNRGKDLSNLELLKNRLIYLNTIYDKKELDDASRKNMRVIINGAWKEVYHQLGKNKSDQLDDDNFLRAHWIMYFKYSRKIDYINFLLKKEFNPKRVYKNIGKEVIVEIPEEQRSELIQEESLDDIDISAEGNQEVILNHIEPVEINNFAKSLKDSAGYWFSTFYPDMNKDMCPEECLWIDRLNRINIGYFRPLVMSALKNVKSSSDRIMLYKKIERFIFIAFKVNYIRTNYGNNEFYTAAKELDSGETNCKKICAKIDDKLSFTLNKDGSLRTDDFYNLMFKKFKDRQNAGYYGWAGLRYFLYEYEFSLLSNSIQKKLEWKDLLRNPKDMITIEHIYPTCENKTWAEAFAKIKEQRRKYYNSSLGNLLILSKSINSSLQNDSFEDKKKPKYDKKGNKIRCGYSDGSHSEIEVSQNDSWGPKQIKDRGVHLLKFMEKRWGFSFKNDTELEKLLFLDIE